MEGERAEQAGEEGRKSVLLEKTNHLKGDPSPPRTEETPGAGTARRVKAERGQSAFTEVRRVPQGAGESGKVAPSSAFSPVPTARGGYMDSAFGQSCAGRAPGCCDASGDVTVANMTRYRAGILPPPEYSSLPKTQARPAPPEMWPKPRAGPAAHCPPLLPATFTPLGATAQNWCAKCSLSFRMTSDLVLHMRSRHKRDAGGETQRRRRREPELSCPVCCEDFRERHHLSRHMTSHC
ncbi:hypothetical protein FKM82_018257 [Ascaphus truei]